MNRKIINTALLAAVVAGTFVLVRLMRIRSIQQKAVHSLDRPDLDGPIRESLKYYAPDWRFEQIVRDNPQWRNRPPVLGGTALTDCAILGLTNHISILLKYGENPTASLQYLRSKFGNDHKWVILIEKTAKMELSPTTHSLSTDSGNPAGKEYENTHVY